MNAHAEKKSRICPSGINQQGYSVTFGLCQGAPSGRQKDPKSRSSQSKHTHTDCSRERWESLHRTVHTFYADDLHKIVVKKNMI